MKIVENHTPIPMFKTLKARCIFPSGESREQMYQAMSEAMMEIWVQGQYAGAVPCTPEHLPELAAGWLCYEKKLSAANEIREIRIEDGKRESVHHLTAHVTLEHSVSGMMAVSSRRRPVEEWGWLYALQLRFEQERPLRRKTKASHSCMLARLDGGQCEVLFHSEDAGRHSAIDKAIGWGILHHIALSACVLFTSGRISETMTEKAAVAGLRALTTGKPLVSTGAVETAARTGLILAGLNQDGQVIVFAGEKDGTQCSGDAPEDSANPIRKNESDAEG